MRAGDGNLELRQHDENFSCYLVDRTSGQPVHHLNLTKKESYGPDGDYKKFIEFIHDKMGPRLSHASAYDQGTLNFVLRANLHGNKSVLFWNAEPDFYQKT